MIEVQNPMLVGGVAAVVFLGAWVGLFWVLNRPRRFKTGGIVFPVVEEATDGVTLAPWSPTRGFYWFAATDLPEVYHQLTAVEGASYKQFGEDEDDARRQLHARLWRKMLEGPGAGDLPPITAAASRFQPLNKRKARTP